MRERHSFHDIHPTQRPRRRRPHQISGCRSAGPPAGRQLPGESLETAEIEAKSTHNLRRAANCRPAMGHQREHGELLSPDPDFPSGQRAPTTGTSSGQAAPVSIVPSVKGAAGRAKFSGAAPQAGENVGM